MPGQIKHELTDLSGSQANAVLHSVCYSMLYYHTTGVLDHTLPMLYICYKIKVVCFLFKETLRLSKCQSYLSLS